jgi:hypothetical protein
VKIPPKREDLARLIRDWIGDPQITRQLQSHPWFAVSGDMPSLIQRRQEELEGLEREDALTSRGKVVPAAVTQSALVAARQQQASPSL